MTAADLGRATHRLATTAADLPDLSKVKELFMDCETRRRGDDLRSYGREPWLGDVACGWAVTFDDCPWAIYAPVAHRGSAPGNLPAESVQRWIDDALAAPGVWINHGIKFDAHFACAKPLGQGRARKLVDTLTQAKIVDSDRMSHGLKDLLRDWLGVDQVSEALVRRFLDGYKLPRRQKANDYALVPPDLLGYYACDDVINTRALHRWLNEKIPVDCVPTWEMEQRLTELLLEVERDGLRVDQTEVKLETAASMQKQIKMATRIAELTGLEWVDGIAFCTELLVGKWGLPILMTQKNEKGEERPTFQEDALKLYLAHPEVSMEPERLEVVSTILKLREEETYMSLFLNALQEQSDPTSRVHPKYNQIVRTGRMSCSGPNSQQMNDRAKRLIHPDDASHGFMDWDASQIEFRIITHYTKQPEIIEAYRKNPRIDYHQWVADMCKMRRKPAKNINFAMAFGAGKRKILSMIMADEDVIAASKSVAGGDPESFRADCKARAESVWTTYHKVLSNLKLTMDRTASVARTRGFVFNAYGRRRHLPAKAAHVAFNTLCQGTAMDFIKRRMLELSDAPWFKAGGARIRANVHDSVLIHAPLETLEDPSFGEKIRAVLEAPEPLFRVPMAWDGKLCKTAWHEGDP